MFASMTSYTPTAQDDAILGALMRPDHTLDAVAVELKLAPSYLLSWASRPEIRALLSSLSELLAITEGIRRAARATTSFNALERVMKESSNLEQVRRAATTTLNAKPFSPSLREGAGGRASLPSVSSLAPPDPAPIGGPEAHRGARTEASAWSTNSARPASYGSSDPLPSRREVAPPPRTFVHGSEPLEPAPARRTPSQSRPFPAAGVQHLFSPGPKGHQPVATRVSGWWPRSAEEPQRGDSGFLTCNEPPPRLAACIDAPTPRARDRP